MDERKEICQKCGGDKIVGSDCRHCLATYNEGAPVNSDGILSVISAIVLVLGVLGSILLFVLSGTVNNRSDFSAFASSGFDTTLLVASILCFLQAIILSALLKGFSDIIRLLKGINSKA